MRIRWKYGGKGGVAKLIKRKNKFERKRKKIER